MAVMTVVNPAQLMAELWVAARQRSLFSIGASKKPATKR